MKVFDTSSGSSDVSVGSLEEISSCSSSLDVDLLNLNGSSEDEEQTSSSDDDDNLGSYGASRHHDTWSGAEAQRKPPRLQLPRISFQNISGLDSHRGVTRESVERSVGPAQSSRGSSRAEGELQFGESKSSETRFSVDLLTPSFNIVVSSLDNKESANILGSVRTRCAEKFGIRNDRVRLFNLSPVNPVGGGACKVDHGVRRIGIEIEGSEFTLERLEEMLHNRDKLEKEKKQTKDCKDASLKSLQVRVRELERKLLLSETMRLKAHNTLQELRYEIDLLESSISKKL